MKYGKTKDGGGGLADAIAAGKGSSPEIEDMDDEREDMDEFVYELASAFADSVKSGEPEQIVDTLTALLTEIRGE